MPGITASTSERSGDRHDRQRVVEHGLVLDDVVVHDHAGDRLVAAATSSGKVAEALERVAVMRSASEVHHRIADMGQLEVEQPGDPTVLEHELEGVVGDEARRCTSVLRDVVAHPAPEKHLDRIGGIARPCRGRRRPSIRRMNASSVVAESAGTGRAGCGRGVERDGVDAREQLEVLLQHAITVGIGRASEVDQAREAVHHQGVRVVADAVGVGHRAVRAPPAGRAPRPRRRCDSASAICGSRATMRAVAGGRTVELDVDVPRRTPSRHALDAGDAATHVLLDPCGEVRAVLVALGVHAFLHVTENI